jgi:hypothetical protein
MKRNNQVSGAGPEWTEGGRDDQPTLHAGRAERFLVQVL